ncbi:1,4-dihydroxy-2-naphthoate octaprenyltransferase [Tamlana sp. 2_MG-2023]|uniref:1,4-dihydroxy-2-naphthoate octaprenyltransferase n=1 Tax=unclassified Tamlana TaxID=2614803 RepID=UPI0026E3A0DC|nr:MULTISPECIES: 1,4-dihydroxy-2-naphthoate octaprenyltransferase [unclassified Tamlana]MDO6759344.1 1,4-dihydroxy-2-naphthoate octaprenyltransferase [Tamlana sp. 2_MG-2023]MDO6790517.1 1,4-dihydroxy-2-naphthoate octaprenyltransferase [Tamlana sp. 1_MG-2023]
MDSIMENVSTWISAMRLRTLPLSVSGIILASCLAQYHQVFSWSICIIAILTTLSLQILSNLANDYGDGIKGTDNDDRIGPQRAIQSGKISPKQLLNAIIINVIIALFLAVLLIFTAFGSDNFLLSSLFLVIGIASVVAAIKYTVGSSAFGYKGLGDIFVFIFFGLVSVMGCYVLYAKNISVITVLPAITVGLLSTGVLNLNNMRDRISDKKSNKITLAVKLGEKKVKVYHNILIVSAIILSALFGVLYYTSIFNLIYFIAYIPLIIHLKTVNNNKDLALLDPELKKLALTTVLLALLMGIGQLL